MPYGLYISAEGALAQSLRMEVISNNLANVDTTGFKRDLALFQARYAEATARGLDMPGSGSVNDLGGGVEVLSTHTDFSTGPLKATQLPTDMAIEGEGFFMVRRGEQDLLTRAGDFMLTPGGALVTQEGYPVLGAEGNPVVIDPQAGPWQVSPDGGIQQAGETNFLALVSPASLGDLVKTGENLFQPLAPARPVDASQRRVLSGYLEHSGVKAVTEMTDMIETSRAFEANVNMIRNQDQMLGTLVSRVLRS